MACCYNLNPLRSRSYSLCSIELRVFSWKLDPLERTLEAEWRDPSITFAGERCGDFYCTKVVLVFYRARLLEVAGFLDFMVEYKRNLNLKYNIFK